MRRRLIGLLVILVSVALLLWVLGRIGWTEIWAQIRRTSPLPAVIALGLFGLRYPVWTWRWTRIVRRVLPVRYGALFPMLLTGAFLNYTTPTARMAGGFGRAFLLGRHTRLPKTMAYGTVLVDQMAGNLSGGLLGGLAVLALPAAARAGVPGYPALAAVAGAALAGLLALLFTWERWTAALERRAAGPWPARVYRRWYAGLIRRRFASSEAFQAWAAEQAERLLHPLRSLGGRPWMLASDLALGMAGWLLLAAAGQALFLGFGTAVALPVILLAYAGGGLISAAAFVPGGVGVMELSSLGILAACGAPPATAAAVALLTRVGVSLFTVGLGFGCVLYLRLRGGG